MITRSNDRRLRLSASDWVKKRRSLDHHTHQPRRRPHTVRHSRSRLTARLPAHYVQESAGLGYAVTVHAAQGVTADTMHGLVNGQESRQQLYTMLTRGRTANHLYLQVVGNGDPHTVIRPELISPRTPSELLEQILPTTRPPPQPRPSCASSAIRGLDFGRRCSATPTGCTPPPNSSSDPASWTRSTAEPTRSCGRHRRGGLADPAN